jgi:hypothetical protein
MLHAPAILRAQFCRHHRAGLTTEMNRMRLVLFDMDIRILGPYMEAMNMALISLMV